MWRKLESFTHVGLAPDLYRFGELPGILEIEIPENSFCAILKPGNTISVRPLSALASIAEQGEMRMGNFSHEERFNSPRHGCLPCFRQITTAGGLSKSPVWTQTSSEAIVTTRTITISISSTLS